MLVKIHREVDFTKFLLVKTFQKYNKICCGGDEK